MKKTKSSKREEKRPYTYRSLEKVGKLSKKTKNETTTGPDDGSILSS